ncbi:MULTISPECIES: transcriptional regulator [Sporosarcina]|uniref:Transcriptional regulator n=1 Tax=Sporosarcina contaminans TaxID=633403 RepID=A0ABW3TWC1_9BACL
MRKELEKALKFGDVLLMVYMANDGTITKRTIKVLQIGNTSFRAFCYLRKGKRTFSIENVLAIIPAKRTEKRAIG